MFPGVIDLSLTESGMKKGWPAQVAILLSHIRKMPWDIVGVKIYSHFAVPPSSFSAVTPARTGHHRAQILRFAQDDITGCHPQRCEGSTRWTGARSVAPRVRKRFQP